MLDPAANPAQVPPSITSPVVVNTDELKVPALVGLPVRKVIETAALAGLEVQIMGSGTVREQAPAPGAWLAPERASWCGARGSTTSNQSHGARRARQTTIDHDMHWKELIAEIPAVGASGDTAQIITAIEYDSRRIKPGAVFVAMKGGSTDGNRYIDKAIGNGALGIITDSSPTFDHLLVYRAGLPVLEVEHGRARPCPGVGRLLWSSRAQTQCHGYHRHEWQDHDGISDRVAVECCRAQHGTRWHYRIPRRRRGAPVNPHHA